MEEIIMGAAEPNSNGIQGGFIKSSLYGCFMTIGVILALYLIRTYKVPKTGLVLLGIVNVAIAISLLLSYSRTAWIATLFGMAILFFCRFQKEAYFRIKRYRRVLLVAVAWVLIAIVCNLWQLNTSSVSGRFLIKYSHTYMVTSVIMDPVMANPVSTSYADGQGYFIQRYLTLLDKTATPVIDGIAVTMTWTCLVNARYTFTSGAVRMTRQWAHTRTIPDNYI